MFAKSGMMSDIDIRKAIVNNEMCITPFDVNDPSDRRLTPAGFNFSFSRFIVSLNQKAFYQIHEKDDKMFFYIEPGDTAIALTRESIWVSRNIGGTFHSKVGYVSQGLGHISTTLDPCWQGQLLISVNNPNKKKITVNIASFERGEWVYSTFITLCLFRLISPASRKSDNHAARLDTLYNIIKSSKRTKKQMELIETIREMLALISNQEGVRLSELKVVKDSHIQKFTKEYAILFEAWDRKYEKDIRHLSRSILARKKLSSFVPLIISVIFVLIIIGGVWRLNQPFLINLLIPLFSATLAYIVALITASKKT